MLITIEGIDGSGKTAMVKYLRKNFTDICYTSEPTENFEFSRLRPLDNEYDSIYNFFLFTYDRLDHQKYIEENKDKTIISDRYIASSIAYEGPLIEKLFGNKDETIKYMLNVSKVIRFMPDIIIYLGVSIESAMERIKNNRKNLSKNNERLSILEKAETLKKVLEYYDYFLKNIEKYTGKNIQVIRIDANQDIENVQKNMYNIIKNL